MIYHVPILLPSSASKVAVECMAFVNQKLRDVYDPEKNHGRIRVVDPSKGNALTDDMFFKIGETPVIPPPVEPETPKQVVQKLPETPVAPALPREDKSPEAPKAPKVVQPVVKAPEVVKPVVTVAE